MSGILAAMPGILASGAGDGGGGGSGDTEIVTVGYSYAQDAPGVFFEQMGFFDSYGSISNGLFAPLSNAAIVALYWYYDSASNLKRMIFTVTGTFSNSGFTKMRVGSTDFLRANAGFSAAAGFTTWSWDGGSTTPFSGQGTNTTVVFT